MKAFLKKAGLSLLAAACALLWTTCEVGLGEAVDNDAPTLTVTGPAKASIYQGAVTITGTCADDKGVKSVNIVLRNTSTGASYPYSGEIDFSAKSASGEFSWKKTVNEPVADEETGETTYELPDGKYVADVTVTDINGRVSGTSSTAFDIDHTAPFFCVTNPPSLLIDSAKAFGRSVTISGEIADDHDIENMTIRVFAVNADGTNATEITDNLAKTEFTGFETAGGTTVYIAKYFESEAGLSETDALLFKNYKAMYTDRSGVSAGDTAYIYIVPTLKDEVGNESEYCYAATALKSAIAEACGVDAAIDSLQTAQLQRIYNGTYTLGELNAEQRAKALAILKGQSDAASTYFCGEDPENAERRYYFAASVNSNNSPTYDFNGYENPTAAASWVGVNTGGNITITLKAGRDEWGVLPSSLAVNLYSSDSSGTKGALAFSSASGETDQTKQVLIKDAANKQTKDIGTSVTNQSYYVTLPSLKAGAYYLLEAEGKDENGGELAPLKSLYGFRVASSVTPPSFSATELFYVNGAGVSSSGGYKFRLNIKDEADEIQTNGVTVKGTIYEGHISGKSYINSYTPTKTLSKTYSGSSAIVRDSDNNYHIDLAIKDFGFSAESGKNYTIVLEGKAKYKDADGSGLVETGGTTFMFWADYEAPALAIKSPKETETLITENFSSYEAQEDDGKAVITPSGTWSDLGGSGTHRLWYTVDDGGAPSANWAAASGAFVSGTYYYEQQAAGCYALVDTDKFVAGETSVSGYYTLSLNPSASGKTWTEISDISQVASATTWEQKIEIEQGIGKIFRVVGVDAVGNMTGVLGWTDLRYDFDIPEISLESEPASNGYYNAADVDGGTLKAVLKISDTYKIETSGVTVTAAKDGTEAASGSNGYTLALDQTDEKTVTATITLASGGTSDGEWKFSASAVDSAGRSALPIEWTRVVDTVKPSFAAFSGAGAAIDGQKIAVGSGSDKSKWTAWDGSWYSSTGLVFNGNLVEETSGLAKISYRLLAAGASEELSGERSKTGEKGSAASPVEFSLTATGFEQSVRDSSGNLTSNALWIKAVDKAGNESDEQVLVINVDQGTPSFAAAYYSYVASPAAADLSAAEGTLVSNGKKDMTVYGTLSCPLSGAAGLAWQIAADSVSPALEYTMAESLSSREDYVNAEYAAYDSIADKYKITGWKAVVSAADLAAGDVYVTASNLSGRNVRTQVFSIDKDEEAPTITLNTPDTKIAAYKAVSAGTEDTGIPTAKPDGTAVPTEAASVNGTLKISGNVSDNKELAWVKFYRSENSDAEIDESRATNPDTEIAYTGSLYNWTISDYQFSKLDEDKTKFLFADDSEYTGTPKTLYIKVAAADNAENTAVAVYQYSIDPGSDRPQITFTVPDDISAMTGSNYVLKKNTSVLRGKVEDDDGLSGFKLFYNDNGETSGGGLLWTELPLTSGVFELFNDSGDHDSEHAILFKAIDANGTTFVSGDGTGTNKTWLRPKIYKSASEWFGSTDSDDTSVYIAIDTKKPRITNKTYSTEKSPSVANSSSTLGTVGGTRNAFTLFFYAFDESGLDEDKISFVLNGTTFNKASGNLTVAELADDGSENPALKGYHLVTVSGISVHDFDSGSYTGTITVYDKAGMEKAESLTVEVDNTPPVLASINPSQTQTVSGNVSAYGTVDGAVSGGLSYALTYTDDDHDRTTAPGDDDYATIAQKSSIMWYVYFDNGITTGEETHAAALNDYIIKNGVTIGGIKADDDTIADQSFSAIVEFTLWVKALDAVGNQTIGQYTIKLDPQGNRPTVTFASPEKDAETVGSDAKMYGGAKAKDSSYPTIKAVYAQIVSTSHDYASYSGGTSWGTAEPFSVTANDLDYLKAAGYTVVKMSDGTTEWNGSGTASEYGVLTTVTGSSWSLRVNKNGELDPADGVNAAAIRVYAFDGKNLSLPDTRTFVVDADTPQLRDDYLEQYGDDGTASAATASKEYEEGMYVKGKWFLTFALTDGQGLGLIQIGKGSSAMEAKNSDNLVTYLKWSDQENKYTIDKTGDSEKIVSLPTADYTRVNIKYPLDTAEGVGTEYVYVCYEDLSGKGGSDAAKTYVISYDNQKPTLAKTTDEKYSIPEIVQQSDGWHSFGSKVSEPNAVDGTKQSGFERLAFYFTRGDYIFDPMIKKGADGNRVSTSGLTFGEGLYWKAQTVTRDQNNLNSITISADANVHAGGLVKLGGTIYRIVSKESDTQITINGNPKAEYTEALFAVANVVDNEIQESSDGSRRTSDYGFGYNTPSNDDGDLMVESIVNSGSDWVWNANIYSKNIADGPVKIHYVAFDKAENYACAGNESDPPVVDAVVSNNRPRIANLYLGTDLNGDNTISADEMADPYQAASLTWNQDYNSGTAVTDATLGSASSAYLTIKGMTSLTPEILGGNGNIYYSYAITSAGGTSPFISGKNAAPFITDAAAQADPLENETARTGTITIQVGDLTSGALRTGGIPDCGETNPHKFVFTFYDQTEDATGTALSGDALFNASRTDKATATVYMAVNMKDDTQPVATREDLFWNGAGAEDADGNPNNSVAWSGDAPLGHIELSDDLPQAFNGAAYTKDGTTYPAAIMDRDSKASGKIVLRGTVSDNKMLYYIYLKIPQMAARFATAGLSQAANGEPGNGCGYRVAAYNASAGQWTKPVEAAAALSNYGIQFTVKNNKVTSSGHSADWEFVWDTSFIANVAAANVTVDVYASDQVFASAVDANGAYTSLNGTTKYAAPAATEKNAGTGANNHPAQLKLDVVPYITGLTTLLSGKGTAYARTAKGHWPVWYRADSTTDAGIYSTSSEYFTVNGFNFSQGNGSLADQTKAESGPLTVTVSAVPSLNNINNNDAALDGTEYSDAYNRQPNGKNNNLLTDDVYIDVWRLNGKAAVPDTLKIQTPTMKINPDNGMIGFAFRYGTASRQFAMPNGTNNSYKWWHTAADIQNSVTFAYDAEGASYGTVAGGESGEGYADFFSFNTSRWGDHESGGATGGNNRDRIEMTGQKGEKTMTPASYSAGYSGTYSNYANGGSTEYANEKTKHQSPAIATAGTNVYLAYYDGFNRELRFRSSLKESFGTGKKTVGNFVDQYTWYKNITTYNYANCQIVAQANTMAQGGEHVGLAAIAGKGSDDDALALVWYDAVNKKMWYSYNDTPNTNRAGTINTQRVADLSANGWSVPEAIFNNKGKRVSGEYCKVAFDGKGGVHIAAYDSAGGDVWYAYFADHTKPEGAVVCRVDSDGQVGENLNLDVALSGDEAVPYISYYETGRSLPKIARPVTAGSFSDGVLGGKFTGTWEVSCVPTASRVEQGNICVGVWKEKDGSIKNSTTGGSYYTNDNSGVCYGNGTKNAVLSYRYTDSSSASRGYLETAQLTGTPESAY